MSLIPISQIFTRILFTMCVSSIGLAWGQDFFPLKDVRPGLRGIGKTVFQGSRIEEFQVEILGVLQNFGPEQSIILARLSGGPLAETGILQGMSGSPVYIQGKLLGAIALGFPFSKEPIAGIQPIQSMVNGATLGGSVNRAGFGNSSFLNGFDSLAQIVSSTPTSLASRQTTPFGDLAEIMTPLNLNGFSNTAFYRLDAPMHRLGLSPRPYSSQNIVTITPKNSQATPDKSLINTP